MIRLGAILLVLFLTVSHVKCQEIDEKGIRLFKSLEKAKPYIVEKEIIKGRQFKISVKTQEDFEGINELITDAIMKGAKNINVEIARGTYYFRENQINRNNEHKGDVTISIEGDEAVLIASGIKYKNGDKYKGNYTPVTTFVDTNNLESYNCWSGIHFADSLIQIIDESKKLCRLPCRHIRDINAIDCKDKYISITQWYMSYTYKVMYVKDGWIYFTADNLARSTEFKRKEYNVNFDYIYAEQNPRYRLCNIPIGDDKPQVRVGNGIVESTINQLYECKVSTFMSLNHSRYKSFTLSGLHFMGNRRGAELICLNDVKANSFIISGCKFESINNAVIYLTDCVNFLFEDNVVRDFYTNGVVAKNGCDNVQIANNTFEHCGWAMSFLFGVVCECQNFYIANNTFRDFCYGAILAGVERGLKKKGECSGIIEYNEIYLTDEYFWNKEKYTMMDAGAIQLRTQNDKTIVRYNYIHDYIGMRSNRGIFCDEGARNFSIYGNTILNTPNSYSIDARRVNDENEGDSLNNKNNLIMYNFVDNSIRFEGRQENNNNCIKGANIIICKHGSLSPSSQYNYLEWFEDDFIMDYYEIKQGKVVVDNSSMKEIKRFPVYKKVSNRFVIN